ncbi:MULTISPECIES: multidrug ABC transporter ATPase [Microbacterium]|uniref:multidrug ABC transporter ATPase n=1 Tax=Microbacterium TaxID=33882 RepID=UPI002789F95A|nr:MULTISPECIES: multidrug ABC transporter ATPase [Microbacterium]MDQ1084601.1 FtsH-binding integral membrane protein [Microbacterium sp. SORGH_AS_0344]MDQ1170122.1 FtsH-binding integral membrane protein [Microbacterium proteolyticum]
MSTRTPGRRTPGDDLPVRRIDRILAFMSLGLLVLALVCFFAIIIGSTAGADLASGVWPVVSLLVLITPPVAFGCLLAVLIMSFVRRARANRAR